MLKRVSVELWFVLRTNQTALRADCSLHLVDANSRDF